MDEKTKHMMERYQLYSSTPDADGILFTAGTAQGIAYERDIESKREDRLFNDHLAHLFVGERGAELSEFFNISLGHHFKVDNFHMIWTPVRTKYINDTIADWITAKQGAKVQVTNLGAGVDTRAFWLDCLKSSEKYVEVDVESINTFKEKQLAKAENAVPLCPRQVITMDFMKESTKDMPNHGYDQTLPTFWLLEGLIMYMTRETVVKMMNEIVDLSVKGSSVMVNFMNAAAG